MFNEPFIKKLSAVVGLLVLAVLWQQFQLWQIETPGAFTINFGSGVSMQRGSAAQAFADKNISPVEMAVKSVKEGKAVGTIHYFVSGPGGDFERRKEVTVDISKAEIENGKVTDVVVGARLATVVFKESPEDSSTLTALSFQVYPPTKTEAVKK